MPNDFTTPASEERVQRTAAALRTHNIEALVVDTGEDAKRAILERIPDGAEVHSGASKTLLETGIQAELASSSRVTWLRNQLQTMDRVTQAREFRKLGAAPDIMLGSVQAVTEDGSLVAASFGGSQLAPYASTAGQVLLVIGAQKVVKDLDEAMRRIYDHALGLESERLRATFGIDSQVGKILIINREVRPGRTTVVLVREALGF